MLTKSISILVITTIALLLVLLCAFVYMTIVNNASQKKKIPKIIWTYWDGEIPYLVMNCIQTWKTHNPDYRLIVLNKSVLNQYLGDDDYNNWRHCEKAPRFSDFVRLNILKRYGGIWMDASIVCNKPLDWIHGIQETSGSEFVGYFLEQYTYPEYINTSPVIESWFLACVPGSSFIRDWCDEFMRINNFDNVLQYNDDLLAKGTSFQNIDYLDYLTIHLSAQHILQQRSNAGYKIHVLQAENGPYKWLVDNEWDSVKASEAILKGVYNNNAIIKLRSPDRTALDKVCEMQGHDASICSK